MEVRNGHYSLNGHEVTVTEFGFTATSMGLNREVAQAGTEIAAGLLSDDELIAAFSVPAQPRRMTKVERALYEGVQFALLNELEARGYDADTLRWG